MKNDEVERNLGFLIHDVARLMRTAFDRGTASIGLTRSQWWVMVYLYRQDGLTQTELAEVLDLGKVTLGGLIDRLEAKGWVKRQPDPVDRRVKRIFLTDQAGDVTSKMVVVGRNLMGEVTQGMSRDEHDQLVDLLVGLKANLLEAGLGPKLVFVAEDQEDQTALTEGSPVDQQENAREQT